MQKIMLMIDSPPELKFLNKLLKRLEFNVLALQKGQGFGEGMADFFPDIFFTSSLGKQSKTLSALAKVKEIKGIPKVIFVRKEKETTPLSESQRKVIDGVLYSPIDPFKLLDLLSEVTEISIDELKLRYKRIIQGDGKGLSVNKKEGKHGGVLIIDSQRKKKYQEICNSLKRPEGKEEFDSKKLRELQLKQGETANDDPQAAVLKRDFIITLFSEEPQDSE